MMCKCNLVWIKNIWWYFLDNTEVAYICTWSGETVFENNLDTIKIPKIFSRVGLLRDFIQNSNNKNLIRITKTISDSELPNFYHINYAPYDLDDNPYSLWKEYGKNKIFIYASNWCKDNNLPYTSKIGNMKDKLGYLSI